jgi:hypothetical protein
LTRIAVSYGKGNALSAFNNILIMAECWWRIDEHEELSTLMTANPTLRRFLDVLTDFQADPQSSILAEDFPTELLSTEVPKAAVEAGENLERRFESLKVGYAQATPISSPFEERFGL